MEKKIRIKKTQKLSLDDVKLHILFLIWSVYVHIKEKEMCKINYSASL